MEDNRLVFKQTKAQITQRLISTGTAASKGASAQPAQPSVPCTEVDDI